MVVLIVGATGPSGLQVLNEAERQKIAVRSLARRPDALADVANAGEVVRGDVLDEASLTAAMAGVDAVISVLGSKPGKGPQTMLETGTRNLVAAATAQGVTRLVVVTGMGAGDSKGHGGFFYDRILQPLLLKKVYEDKDRQEDVVRASGLDWTLVRPGFLTDGPRTGTYKIIGHLGSDTRLGKISRADVAAYLVDAAVNGSDSHATVHLTY